MVPPIGWASSSRLRCLAMPLFFKASSLALGIFIWRRAHHLKPKADKPGYRAVAGQACFVGGPDDARS